MLSIPFYYHRGGRPSIVHQGYQFVRHTVPAVIRPIRTLWHEIKLLPSTSGLGYPWHSHRTRSSTAQAVWSA
jgi:hypothetical protein